MDAKTAALLMGSLSEIGGAFSQAQALRAQGRYQRQVAQTNAMLAEAQAGDAIKRGEKEADRLRRQASQVRGAQRAAFAAQGLDISFGSAADVQGETYELSELDAMALRNNAFREAWGYRMNAANAAAEGRFAQISSSGAAANTLLTGGLRAMGSGLLAYQSYRDNNPPKQKEQSYLLRAEQNHRPFTLS